MKYVEVMYCYFGDFVEYLGLCCELIDLEKKNVCVEG